MKKEQFLELCTTKPEEVFKLFCVMGETINTLQNQVLALNEQVEKLHSEIKELKSRLDKNSRNSNKPPSTDEFTNFLISCFNIISSIDDRALVAFDPVGCFRFMGILHTACHYLFGLFWA